VARACRSKRSLTVMWRQLRAAVKAGLEGLRRCGKSHCVGPARDPGRTVWPCGCTNPTASLEKATPCTEGRTTWLVVQHVEQQRFLASQLLGLRHCRYTAAPSSAWQNLNRDAGIFCRGTWVQGQYRPVRAGVSCAAVRCGVHVLSTHRVMVAD
jgi:hypothetical protein